MKILYSIPPAVLPIFDPKNVNSVKTTLYYGPKKSIAGPFFPIFTKNNCSHAHILSKKRAVSKKLSYSHARILSKNFNPPQKTVLSYHFFSILNENSLLSYPYLDRKCQFGQTTLYHGVKQSRRCPFFRLPLKKYCSHAHIS